jgi:hypothetical protein
MTTIMFAGMSLCLPLALAKDKVARSGRAAAAAAEAVTPLLLGVEPAPPPAAPPSQSRVVARLARPPAFGRVAAVLINIGLLKVPVIKKKKKKKKLRG